MKKLILVAFLMFLSFADSLAQDHTPLSIIEDKASLMPSDFPRYVRNGDSKKDALDYKNAKNKWIAQHKEQYKMMQGMSQTSGLRLSDGRIFFSKEAFVLIPKERQNFMLTYPERFVVDGY